MRNCRTTTEHKTNNDKQQKNEMNRASGHFYAHTGLIAGIDFSRRLQTSDSDD